MSNKPNFFTIATGRKYNCRKEVVREGLHDKPIKVAAQLHSNSIHSSAPYTLITTIVLRNDTYNMSVIWLHHATSDTEM